MLSLRKVTKTIAWPPVLVDKTNSGLVFYNRANFYRFEVLCFSLVNQQHTSGITVYNRTVTNIKITAGRA